MDPGMSHSILQFSGFLTANISENKKNNRKNSPSRVKPRVICFILYFIFSPFYFIIVFSLKEYPSKNEMSINLIYMSTVCFPISPPTAASLVTLMSSVLMIQYQTLRDLLTGIFPTITKYTLICLYCSCATVIGNENRFYYLHQLLVYK